MVFLSDEILGSEVIERSSGCLEEFSAEWICPADLLQRISERPNKLKVIQLENCCKARERHVIEACKSFSLLEVLDTLDCKLTEFGIESIGHSCPNLKVFGYYN